MKYYIPYALHQPAKNPDGTIASAPDGDGQIRTGNDRPLFDTLISICNPTVAAVDVAFRFFNRNGSPALWRDGSAERVYRLDRKRSLATTLVAGNVFSDPPQDFIGYAELETRRTSASGVRLDLPVWAMLGGGGFYPQHWNSFSASLPIYTDESTRPDFLHLRSNWFFPYVIPFFEDANHSGARSYRSGLVATNFGKSPVWLHFRYTVGDMYPGAAKEYVFELPLRSRASLVEDLYQLLITRGYTPELNSEGWLAITSRESEDPNSPEMFGHVVPWLLHSNRDYSLFSAGQAFWP